MMKDKCTITVIFKKIEAIFIFHFEILQSQHPSDTQLLLFYPTLSALQALRVKWIEWILLFRNTGRTTPSSLRLFKDHQIQNKLTSQDEDKSASTITG